MTTTEASEKVRIGTRFTVKSDAVYEVTGDPYCGIVNDGRFLCSARKIKDGKLFGATLHIYGKSILTILTD